MTSKSSGAARKSAASPTAAVVMCTTSPAAAPTAARNPARGPLFMPVARANSMSGPGSRMSTVTVTRYAPKSDPFTLLFCPSRYALSGMSQAHEDGMTAKADFTEEEWRTVLEGPPSAGLVVATAQRGGTFRETLAIAKTYAEARKHHGESALLDEIASAKPAPDQTRYHSLEELKEHGLEHLRDAVDLLERKATPEELEDYRRFVLTLADRVANAHREGGEGISPAEQAA